MGASTALGLYMNAFSFLTLLELFSLSHRLVSAREDEDKFFDLLCAVAALNSLCGMAFFYCESMDNAVVGVFMKFCITMGRTFVLILLFLWICYVDFKLNKSRDHLIRRYTVLLAPVAAVFLLFVINLFTGFLFTIDSTKTVHFTGLYYMISAVNMVYFVISCRIFFLYKQSEGRMVYFTILPFVVPVIIGAAGESIRFYTSENVGITVGLVFLYISMASCWQFEDRDPWFCNLRYLRHVCEYLRKGKSSVKCCMIFSGENDKALTEILKKMLPLGGETIKLEEGRYLFLSPNRKSNYLDALEGLIRDATEKHDREKAEAPVAMEVEVHSPREEDQDPAAWLMRAGGMLSE